MYAHAQNHCQSLKMKFNEKKNERDRGIEGKKYEKYMRGFVIDVVALKRGKMQRIKVTNHFSFRSL